MYLQHRRKGVLYKDILKPLWSNRIFRFTKTNCIYTVFCYRERCLLTSCCLSGPKVPGGRSGVWPPASLAPGLLCKLSAVCWSLPRRRCFWLQVYCHLERIELLTGVRYLEETGIKTTKEKQMAGSNKQSSSKLKLPVSDDAKSRVQRDDIPSQVLRFE